ncbi:fatty acid desaturase [Synechococcus sp. CS-205]|uniref:fatty acid desaturase family protein n=1 Tax=Synechococcus sp. CS-205 TaxID=2847984 RepID=UPI00223B677E|nr:fatty acid desaturase [Synechococcus sp. CS-205]MCT0248158.1 fatty acid desaturase [Synechococcus sp. CS-205]
MQSTDQKKFLLQADYAASLRPLLPPEAFLPDRSKIWILLINLAILVLGWTMARHLDQWSWQWMWLYLPFALVMGNSVIALLFSTHDLMHNSAIRNPRVKQALTLAGLALLWMPPTMWKAVHNREHHRKTNSFQDPDRNYLHSQPFSWGKWIQNLFVPSSEVNPILLAVGMTQAWGIHVFRNLTSVLIFVDGTAQYTQASFKVSTKERRKIFWELLAIAALHLGIIAYIGVKPAGLILGYFLPIWIGYAGVIFYIYTNHMMSSLTPVNDPLANSLSLRVPALIDALHFNFSYHTEHHVFPGMNSDYYPVLQGLLQSLYPDRHNLMDATEAWRTMLRTPRHYLNDNVFTDWNGEKMVECPLPRPMG